MATKQNLYLGAPGIAARAGDPTPDPGMPYCEAFSTTENSIVVWDGTRWQVPGKTFVPAAAAPAPLYALTGFSSTAYYSATTGEAGVSTGFGTIVLLYLYRMPTQTGVIHGKILNSGWQIVLSGAGFSCNYHSGAGGFITGPNCPVTVSDTGHVLVLASRITAVPGVIEMALNTVWAATTPAMSGYSADTCKEIMGNNPGTSYPSVDCDVLGILDFRGVPTRAQIDTYVRAARTLGDLPTTFTGATVTHRWSTKDTLGASAVVNGQVGPASLADTVTGAGVDLQARTGSPTVRRLEVATVEARKTYGICGFAGGSRYERVDATGGIRGATSGWWVAIDCYSSDHTLNQFLVCCLGADEKTGYALRIVGGNLSLEIGNGGAAVQVGQVVASSYTNRRFVALLHYTGTTAQLFTNMYQLPGAQLGTNVVTAYGVPAAGTKFCVGDWPTYVQYGGLPFEGVVYRAMGGDYALTTPEINALLANYARDGQLTQVVNKTQHDYDFSADIVETGGDVTGIVPVVIKDRGSVSSPLIRWNLEVGPGGGLRGFTKEAEIKPDSFVGAAAGFYAEILYVPGFNTTEIGQCLIGSTYGNNTGFVFVVWGNNTTYGTIYNGSTSSAFGTYTGTPGVLTHLAIKYTGTSIRAYKDGVLVQDVVFGFAPAPASNGLYIGSFDGTNYPCMLSTILGVAVSLTQPSDAQILTAATAALAAGKIVGIPTVTQKLWSLVDDVAEAGGIVPALIKERIANATALAVVNGSMQVSKRVDRVWGVDSGVLNVGAKSAATSAYYKSVANYNDHSHLPSWYTIVFTVLDQVNTADVHILMSANYTGHGPSFYANSNNTNVVFGLSTTGGFYTCAAAPIPASEIGKTQILTGTFTGTHILQFFRRAAASDAWATTSGTLSPGTATLWFLSDQANRPAYGIMVHGFASGLGALTLDEYQAHYDAIVAADGDIQPIVGKTAHLYSMLRDSVGSALPAPLVDKVGTNNMTKFGSPTYNAVYGRAFAV